MEQLNLRTSERIPDKFKMKVIAVYEGIEVCWLNELSDNSEFYIQTNAWWVSDTWFQFCELFCQPYFKRAVKMSRSVRDSSDIYILQVDLKCHCCCQSSTAGSEIYVLSEWLDVSENDYFQRWTTVSIRTISSEIKWDLFLMCACIPTIAAHSPRCYSSRLDINLGDCISLMRFICLSIHCSCIGNNTGYATAYTAVWQPTVLVLGVWGLHRQWRTQTTT